MLNIASNAQLEEQERAALEEAEQAKNPQLSGLAAYVRKAFSDAEQHRQRNGVTERLLKSRRLKSGMYDDAKLTQIQARGGSQLFFNITETKCEAFEAWLEDVFAPVGERPWDATPTPIPSLPQDMAQTVIDATQAYFAQSGEEPTPEAVQAFALDMYDEILDQMGEDAKERCERMVKKMEDQTAEGGFADALAAFISDLGTYPTAILKGPVFQTKKRLAWTEEGKVEIQSDTVPTWTCVDPMNFYPGPNARNLNESYVCELIDFDKRALSEMRDVEGWNARAINAVLALAPAQPSAGVDTPFAAGHSELAGMEDRDNERNGGMPDATVRAVEFWGAVQGRHLIDWGMPNVDDAFAFYEVQCILIGNVVVRAIFNPDPLGRRPYYATSFIRNKNSVWGLKSIPEKMADCQEGVNGAQRHLLNNLAIASGPQTALDIDALSPQQVATANQMYPWKVWMYRGSKATGARAPVDFFQPQSNSNELIAVTEYYEKKADDRTLIPRYVYGNENLGGAGQTASGLSMLMNAAARGIKRVIKNIDRDVLRPAIQRLYVWNMLYLPDDGLKGDVQVVPRGALAMLVREQVQLRRQEFLAQTNNPTDLAIIGIEGRAAVLRETAKGLDMPVDKIVPDEEALRARVEAQMEQGAEPQQEPPEEGQ